MELGNQRTRLLRILPGVAGYQDKASARDTDKAVRLRVAAEVALLKRDLVKEKERLTGEKDRFPPAAFEEIVSKLGRLEDWTRSASRGYRASFDPASVEPQTLARLYTLDLNLFAELKRIRDGVKGLDRSWIEGEEENKTIEKLNLLLDRFEEIFSERQELLKRK